MQRLALNPSSSTRRTTSMRLSISCTPHYFFIVEYNFSVCQKCSFLFISSIYSLKQASLHRDPAASTRRTGRPSDGADDRVVPAIPPSAFQEDGDPPRSSGAVAVPCWTFSHTDASRLRSYMDSITIQQHLCLGLQNLVLRTGEINSLSSLVDELTCERLSRTSP
jgi:hypothetical protein